MKYTYPEKNIIIEWTHPLVLQLNLIYEDQNRLEGIKRLLTAYVRGAPLEGGEPAEFEHQKDEKNGIITIKGDTFRAICALCSFDMISEQQRDQIIIDMLRETNIRALSDTSISKKTFITTLENDLTTDNSMNAESPKLRLFRIGH